MNAQKFILYNLGFPLFTVIPQEVTCLNQRGTYVHGKTATECYSSLSEMTSVGGTSKLFNACQKTKI